MERTLAELAAKTEPDEPELKNQKNTGHAGFSLIFAKTQPPYGNPKSQAPNTVSVKRHIPPKEIHGGKPGWGPNLTCLNTTMETTSFTLSRPSRVDWHQIVQSTTLPARFRYKNVFLKANDDNTRNDVFNG